MHYALRRENLVKFLFDEKFTVTSGENFTWRLHASSPERRFNVQHSRHAKLVKKFTSFVTVHV